MVLEFISPLKHCIEATRNVVVNLGEQVTSKATCNRNAVSKKLISRESSKIKDFRFQGGSLGKSA